MNQKHLIGEIGKRKIWLLNENNSWLVGFEEKNENHSVSLRNFLREPHFVTLTPIEARYKVLLEDRKVVNMILDYLQHSDINICFRDLHGK